MADPRPRYVVAVDGPAASGKGTLAQRLAERLGLAHLDSGLLYRAVGLCMRRGGHDLADRAAAVACAKAVTAAMLDDPELRTEETGNAATVVAAYPEVRAALVDFQRNFAANPPPGTNGVVMDGRDIGTVILPCATHKIFVDAGPEIRAKRRHKELQERGVKSIYARVLQDMKERDARDRSRSVAPLVPAEDAYVLDTTGLDADAVLSAALDFIHSQNQPDKR